MDPLPPRLAARARDRADDPSGAEQHLKDLQTFDQSHRRRWLLLSGALAVTLLGEVGGLVEAPPATTFSAFGGVGLLNLAVGSLQKRWYWWWAVYALAGLDILVVSLAVLFMGHGGLVAALLLAVLPYGFDHGRRMGDLLVLLASTAYLVASAAHERLYGQAGLPTAAYLEAVVFIVSAMALKQIPAALVQRIRQTRAVMAEAQQGSLAIRAPGVQHDELGFLERSLNRMLDQIGGTISSVQREADEVAAYAEELAASAEELHATSEEASRTASQVAEELRRQRTLAESSRLESGKAAQQAETLRVRAEVMQTDAERLLDAAARGRERVRRASATLRTIGEEVRSTAHTVGGLTAMSARIGKFADTIARIARQTHLLALNAAIEAAQAEGQGEGFAVVADEVRTLAVEAARSAREAAEIISELQGEIGVVARAMQSGEGQVRDVGAVAQEADTALHELEEGVALVGDLVRAAAQVSRSQAQRLAGLAETLEQVATIGRRASDGANTTAAATTGQITAMSDLTATSQQLAQLAERIRASIAQFSVVRPGVVTREYPARRAPAAAD